MTTLIVGGMELFPWFFKMGGGEFQNDTLFELYPLCKPYRKTFEFDRGNVLKEFEAFIFYENLLKACDNTVGMYSMYRETHSR